MSWRHWPNTDYMKNVLIKKMCKKNKYKWYDCIGTDGTSTTCNITRDICSDDVQLNASEWQKNFLRVQIYFEELSYEEIVEKPSYEFVRFISDVGGTMGLFMGASLLSLVEVLQIVLEICLWGYERLKLRQKRQRTTTINVAPIDTTN